MNIGVRPTLTSLSCDVGHESISKYKAMKVLPRNQDNICLHLAVLETQVLRQYNVMTCHRLFHAESLFQNYCSSREIIQYVKEHDLNQHIHLGKQKLSFVFNGLECQNTQGNTHLSNVIIHDLLVARSKWNHLTRLEKCHKVQGCWFLWTLSYAADAGEFEHRWGTMWRCAKWRR